jgi:GMP synthase (glutamine-hydrolysing)
MHHHVEGLGTIAGALKRAAVAAQYIRSFEGQTVPKEIGDAAGLIVMGGPQSVYEQAKFPCLRKETRLIEDALKHGKPVLGVCLGSQLLATTLGANVYPSRQKEIGWHRVTLTKPSMGTACVPTHIGGASVPACGRDLFSGELSSLMGFHWHGDIFDLPRGATLLASSALTAHQAFRYGKNAYGLLFHMEVTLPQIDTMVATFADELQSAGLNGSAIKLNSHPHLPALQRIGQEAFSRWVALL